MPYKKLEYGKWELHLPPNADGSCPLKHNSEVKLIIKSHNNELLERLSPWATYVTQNKSEGTTYKQRIWHPENVLDIVTIKNVFGVMNKKIYNVPFPDVQIQASQTKETGESKDLRMSCWNCYAGISCWHLFRICQRCDTTNCKTRL